MRFVAIRAVITANCSGELRVKPWPIEALTVSPITQSAPRDLAFHSLVGARPAATDDRGKSCLMPRPNRLAISDIFSIPTLSARS